MNCRTFFNPCGHLPVPEPVKYAGTGQAIGSIVGGLLGLGFNLTYWAAPDLFKALSKQAFRGIVYGGGPACLVGGALIGAAVGAVVMQYNKCNTTTDIEEGSPLLNQVDIEVDEDDMNLDRSHRLM